MRNVITKIIFHNIMVTMARFEVDREFLTRCCGFGDTKSQTCDKIIVLLADHCHENIQQWHRDTERWENLGLKSV